MSAPVNRTRKALMAIRDMIVSGEISSGARVSEVLIAEQLGLSRTPVRAALAKLEQEGLLEAMTSGGYATRSFTRADVIDAIELRGVLEGTAARLAAERGISERQMNGIKETVEALDLAIGDGPDTLDFHGYIDLNAQFHEQLADLPRSPTIRREIERVTALPFASPSAFLDKQADVSAFRRSLVNGQIQHRAIIDAIAQREGARAEALAREHARLARSNLDYVFTENRELLARMPALTLISA